MESNVAAILLDLGDTIMDEDTEVKDEGGTTRSAGLIPGMAEALRLLHDQGYPLALVADSRRETPPNVLKQHGLMELFDHLAVSEDVGREKPDPVIFRHALDALGISEPEYPRVMMVGNNLERDIVGANHLGIRSVYFHANDHRRTIPRERREVPRHTVDNARELLDLVADLAVETSGSQAPGRIGKAPDLDLAARHAPVIRFDEAEPFMPLVVGYSILGRERQSPSFLRHIRRDGRPAWATVIEYAIWWDWDIGHLYELEHVWVYLDAAGAPVWVEASSHGDYASMILEDRSIPMDGTHPVVFSQPGKHAFAPTAHFFEMFRDMVLAETTARAGCDGILVKPEYARQIVTSPATDSAVSAWLKERAFVPTMKFDRVFRVGVEMLVPWPVLDAWIPKRVTWWVSRLAT